MSRKSSRKAKRKSKKKLKKIDYPIWSKPKKKTKWATEWNYPAKSKWKFGYRESCKVKKKKYKRKSKMPLGGYDSLKFMTEDWESKPKEYGHQFRTDKIWYKSKPKKGKKGKRKGKTAHQKRVAYYKEIWAKQQRTRQFHFKKI